MLGQLNCYSCWCTKQQKQVVGNLFKYSSALQLEKLYLTVTGIVLHCQKMLQELMGIQPWLITYRMCIVGNISITADFMDLKNNTRMSSLNEMMLLPELFSSAVLLGCSKVAQPQIQLTYDYYLFILSHACHDWSVQQTVFYCTTC